MNKKHIKFINIDYFPLQKVKIVQSNKVCKPGSVGYVCWTKQSSHMAPLFTNLIKIMFMRFGKKGKPRVTSILLPYLCVDIVNDDNKIKIYDLLNKYHMAKGPRRRNRNRQMIKHQDQNQTGPVTLAPAVQTTKDIRNLSSIEFLCYISAFSSYINHLTINYTTPSPKHIINPQAKRIINPLPPVGLFDVFNNMRDLLKIDNIRILHRTIETACKYDSKKNINNDIHNDQDISEAFNCIKQFFHSNRNRQLCMNNLYVNLSILSRAVKDYHIERYKNNITTHNYAIKLLHDLPEDNA